MPDKEEVYQYKNITRIYWNAKKKFLDFKKLKNKQAFSTPLFKKLQKEIMAVTATYRRDKTEALAFKLMLLHQKLLDKWRLEKQLKFKAWLSKLNKLGYHRATRSFYAELNSRSNTPDKIRPIRNKLGILSTSLAECLKNWREYKALYRRPKKTFKLGESFDKICHPLSASDTSNLNRDISWNELILAVNTLGDYSSPGADQILNRDLTVLLHEDENGKADKDGVQILNCILMTLKKLWREEKVPAGLKQSIIQPFLKEEKKDATLPQNYRPISLLNSLMKTYEQVIKSRLVEALEKHNFFSYLQAAYRKSHSACDHILVLQEIFIYFRHVKIGPRGGRGNQILYLCFLDLKKAFDSVPRSLLFQKLAALGVEGKILNIIKDLYSSNSACVRIGEHTSEPFTIDSGVLQGSKLAPILFIIYINDL